jgi:hypothetical protein
MARRAGGWSKYRAVKTTVGEITFASKLEARRYQELLLLESAREIAGLQLQVPFDLAVNGHLICRYIADFCYTATSSGERVVEDAKGVMTPEFRLKAKLMEAIHGIVIQVWTGKPQWGLDTVRGRWLRATAQPRSRKTTSRGKGSPSSF